MKLSLLLPTTAAAIAPAAEKYTVYETDHLELITDGSRGRSFIVKTLATRNPILKPRIVVFQNEKDYRDCSIYAVSAAHCMSLPQRGYIAMGPAKGGVVSPEGLARKLEFLP